MSFGFSNNWDLARLNRQQQQQGGGQIQPQYSPEARLAAARQIDQAVIQSLLINGQISPGKADALNRLSLANIAEAGGNVYGQQAGGGIFNQAQGAAYPSENYSSTTARNGNMIFGQNQNVQQTPNGWERTTGQTDNNYPTLRDAIGGLFQHADGSDSWISGLIKGPNTYQTNERYSANQGYSATPAYSEYGNGQVVYPQQNAYAQPQANGNMPSLKEMQQGAKGEEDGKVLYQLNNDNLFAAVDTDDNGKLSAEELAQASEDFNNNETLKKLSENAGVLSTNGEEYSKKDMEILLTRNLNGVSLGEDIKANGGSAQVAGQQAGVAPMNNEAILAKAKELGLDPASLSNEQENALNYSLTQQNSAKEGNAFAAFNNTKFAVNTKAQEGKTIQNDAEYRAENEKYAEVAVKEMDANNDGKVNEEEYVAAQAKKHSNPDEKAVASTLARKQFNALSQAKEGVKELDKTDFAAAVAVADQADGTKDHVFKGGTMEGLFGALSGSGETRKQAIDALKSYHNTLKSTAPSSEAPVVVDLGKKEAAPAPIAAAPVAEAPKAQANPAPVGAGIAPIFAGFINSIKEALKGEETPAPKAEAAPAAEKTVSAEDTPAQQKANAEAGIPTDEKQIATDIATAKATADKDKQTEADQKAKEKAELEAKAVAKPPNAVAEILKTEAQTPAQVEIKLKESIQTPATANSVNNTLLEASAYLQKMFFQK